MRHGIPGALLLTLTLLPVAIAQGPDAERDPSTNAALKYWQAFTLLPAMDKSQEKILEEWNKAPLDAAALTLIERSETSRLYFHRGAVRARCDWNEDYQDGIALVLPHLPKSVTLARLTALHARHEFAQGHWKAGAEDVADMLRLARHIEMDRIIIANLVGYKLEWMAIETAAPYLPDLKRVLPETAGDVLDAFPTGPTVPQMVLMEKQIGAIWLIDELKKSEQQKPGGWRAVWEYVFHSGEGGPDRSVVDSVKTFERAVTLLEQLLPAYDQLAAVSGLPWKEFDARYPEFEKTSRTANPMAGVLLPSMDKYVASKRRAETQMALFKAALGVVQDGPGRLKDIKDPFGDGPFEYRALDRGFELKSSLVAHGKPVTLTVGQPKN